MEGLTSSQGARLIEDETGRQCTRQNLEKLARRGALRDSASIVQTTPLRFDPNILVSDYLTRVAPTQQPTVTVTDLPAVRSLPAYTESRARSEFERANLLALERKQRDGELLEAAGVRREAFRQARSVRDGMLAIPWRLAPLLAAESDPNKCGLILRAEIEHVLTALADAGNTPGAPPPAEVSARTAPGSRAPGATPTG
jgi:hypothetical protein